MKPSEAGDRQLYRPIWRASFSLLPGFFEVASEESPLPPSPLLETLTPLLIGVGLLWGAIIRILVSIRRDRARLDQKGN